MHNRGSPNHGSIRPSRPTRKTTHRRALQDLHDPNLGASQRQWWFYDYWLLAGEEGEGHWALGQSQQNASHQEVHERLGVSGELLLLASLLFGIYTVNQHHLFLCPCCLCVCNNWWKGKDLESYSPLGRSIGSPHVSLCLPGDPFDWRNGVRVQGCCLQFFRNWSIQRTFWFFFRCWPPQWVKQHFLKRK